MVPQRSHGHRNERVSVVTVIFKRVMRCSSSRLRRSTGARFIRAVKCKQLDGNVSVKMRRVFCIVSSGILRKLYNDCFGPNLTVFVVCSSMKIFFMSHFLFW